MSSSNSTGLYPYNYKKGVFWIDLLKIPPILSAAETVAVSDLGESKPEETMSYYSDTGQLNSNCFFFVEGIDSDVVTKRVSDILSTTKKQSSLPDIVNLENEDLIASFVFKYVIQNNHCDFKLMDDCLSYLSGTSLYFSDKILGGGGGKGPHPMKKVLHGSNSSSYISRCSYKFCIQSYCCQYNYPESKKKRGPSRGCYSDHFPHRKVYQDIVSLHTYIQHLQQTELDGDKNIVIRSNQEIIKCINTIAYVIKHMYDELWNIYVSCKRDSSYEKLHRNLGAL